MRISKAPSFTLGVAFGVAMLAGCSGGNSQTASIPAALKETREQSSVSPEAKGGPLIFVSFPQSNAVDIFLQARKNKMVGQITGLSQPVGLATDTSGNLYIANQSGTTVPVYAPPYKNPPKLILDDTGYLPQGVTVSPSGVVALANFCNHSGCTTEYTISFYTPNSTTPCANVPVSRGVFGSLAFDDAENVFIAGQYDSQALIGEIKGGCKAKTARFLTTKNSLGPFASGVQIDKADRIAVLGLDTSIVYTYNHPKNGSLGNPVSTTTLGGSSGAFSFVFLASGRDLYANINLNSVSQYDYPTGGTAEHAIAASSAGGIAVTPPLIP